MGTFRAPLTDATGHGCVLCESIKAHSNPRQSYKPMPDFRGSIIHGGRYKLVELLGSGAFGVVYRAIDMHVPPFAGRVHMQRAIKIIRKAGPLKSDTARQRQEISLHSLVSKHPNILSLYDAFEYKDFYFLVMEFVPGGDLYTRIVDGQEFHGNDELVRSVFVQILDAVEACHAMNVYHRDLKPENILCSTTCRKVYLADFGLATTRAVSGTFGCGSSHYMSPECINESGQFDCYSTAQNDIWALGVILVNLVTGCNPWQAARNDDLCYEEFLTTEAHFYDRDNLSDGVAELLHKIFDLNAHARPTIPEMRRTIMGLRSFWKKPVKTAAPIEAFEAEIEEVPRVKLPKGTEAVDELTHALRVANLGDADVEEVDLGTLSTISYDEHKMPSGSSSASTSTSGDDSAGPATPDKNADEPHVSTADFASELDKALLPLATPAKDTVDTQHVSALLGRLGLA